jgi:hypothetical protein
MNHQWNQSPCEKVVENPISIAIDTDETMIRLSNVIFLFLYGAAVADSRESFDFCLDVII